MTATSENPGLCVTLPLLVIVGYGRGNCKTFGSADDSPANPDGFTITSMVIIFQIKHFIPEKNVTADANNG